MWLVSCREQEMLTQGLAAHAKCELNIAFLTLSHCPICAKDMMVTVL